MPKEILSLAGKFEYEGEFARNRFHGHGKLKFACGDEYLGSFENGLRHGFGVWISHKYNLESQSKEKYSFNFLLSDFKEEEMLRYEGFWEHGWQTDDRARIIFSNSISYEGGIKDGKLSGSGRLLFGKGNEFEGSFWRGYIHGEGKMKLNYRFEYTGSWKFNKLSGEGIIKYRNSSFEVIGVVQGTFISKALSCEGHVKRMYSLEDIFEGQMMSGKPHGKGTLVRKFKKHRTFYEGLFIEGVPDQCGKFTFPSHDYIGEVSCGYFKGKGKLNFSDGSSWCGDFNRMENKFGGGLTGFGIKTASNGTIIMGNFVLNKCFGPGCCMTKMNSKGNIPSISLYLGDVANDKAHGQGCCFYGICEEFFTLLKSGFQLNEIVEIFSQDFQFSFSCPRKSSVSGRVSEHTLFRDQLLSSPSPEVSQYLETLPLSLFEPILVRDVIRLLPYINSCWYFGSWVENKWSGPGVFSCCTGKVYKT